MSFQVRYHHDGKYNVMSLVSPIEIYGESFFSRPGSYSEMRPFVYYLVEKPPVLDFDNVRKSLMRIVPLCLDSDPSLIPLSCKYPSTPKMGESSSNQSEDSSDDRDPDDFSFWSERQAKRICEAIKQAFDVEYAPEVVVADANISVLTTRILLSREILTT